MIALSLICMSLLKIMLKKCQEQILDTLDGIHIEEVIKKDFQVEKHFLKVIF